MAVVNKTKAATARSLENQRKALELRRMGLGYTEIAQQLGLGKSQAHRLVKAGLEDAREQIAAQADDLRSEELSRLDGMLAGIWPSARKGNVTAIDRVLKIMERRTKLLGLDAPVRLAHGGDADAPPIESKHVHSYTDADLERIIASGGA